jgi:16S rRNA pseudouridine516 synthase
MEVGGLTTKQKIRLDRLLANMGHGSRREVKQLLKQRRVTVDGTAVTDSGMWVYPDEQQIEVDKQAVVYREFIYLMLNKPAGVLSATEDDRDPTVVDLVAEHYGFYHPFPVGRLDKDTEGFIFLTNDGNLAHGLTSPRSHVPKLYYVEMTGTLEPSDVEAVKGGIDLGDFTTMPGHLEIMSAGEQSIAHLTIYEGKFHQVKRMMLALGKEVTYLKRLSIGSLSLDPALGKGEYRELLEDELKRIRLDIERKV